MDEADGLFQHSPELGEKTDDIGKQLLGLLKAPDEVSCPAALMRRCVTGDASMA